MAYPYEREGWPMRMRGRWLGIVALACALLCGLVVTPTVAWAEGDPVPIYQTLDELAGKRFAYVNGSVYNQRVQEKIDGTTEDFYPSLAECVEAVESGKADAAVQLSYGCQLVVNRRPGTVALLPEPISEVSEGFFFPKGSPLKEEFNKLIAKFGEDGTLAAIEEKWVAADEDGKTLPEQDWDAPNGTLKFATTGVLEPFSYVGQDETGSGTIPKGYDVELALLIARELGYHLTTSTIPMDSIFAAVNSGKADFGGTLTQTPERASVCDFSNTVMPTTISVIVKAEEAAPATELEVNSFEELYGQTIGTLNGSVDALYVEQNLGGTFTSALFNSTSDMVSALKSGKIAAFATDEPIAYHAVNKNTGIGILPKNIIEAEYGFFFEKGSPLRDQFNQVIEAFEADGTLDKLRDKWVISTDTPKTLPAQDWEPTNGTLTMATNTLTEPLVYMENGEPTGYDIEVALLICKELGYGLEIQSQDFSAMLAAVPAGKADFGGGSVTITKEREEVMDFSVPDYHGALVFVVRTTTVEEAKPGLFETFADSFNKTFIVEDRWRLIVGGLGVTILISVCAGILGTLLGFGTVLARRSGVRWVGKLVDGYQAFMGGVPLVVVLMVLYYVVFGSINIAGEIVAIIAFMLAFGSTAGSTMWTAIDGIDIIQEETGLALGYTRSEVFRKIIFPQARQQFTPQLMGQFVGMVKDTAIVGYIAVQDLTRATDLIRSRTMEAFFPLLATALIYFLFCRVLAWALGKFAAKYDTANRPREIEGVQQ